jgi:hypothetical protein
MKRIFLISLGLMVLTITAFFAFYEADPPPTPLIPAPSDVAAASKLQAVIDPDYCATAQKMLAQSGITPINESHLNFESFVKSKPSTEPLTTHQFVHYVPVTVNGQEQAFPAIVSCKLKTAERINEKYPDAKAGPDLPCMSLLEKEVNVVLKSLSPESMAYPAEMVIFADDEMANQGRTWLAPWPYAVAWTEADQLTWQSKAMLIPYTWWNPMPARFLGTHYCHLPTQQYIRGVLSGEIVNLIEPVVLLNSELQGS